MPNKGVCWRKGFKKEKPKKSTASRITTKENKRMTAMSVDDSLDAEFGKEPRRQFNPHWE